MFIVECGVVKNFERHSPVSLEHMSWYLFFDLYHTTHQSKVRVWLRNVRIGSHGIPCPKSQVPLMVASPKWKASAYFQTSRNHELLINYYQSQILIVLFVGIMLRDVSHFLLNPTLNTTPNPHLSKKGLSCRHPCHTWDHVWSGKSHALNGWDCTYWPRVTWGLGLGTPCGPSPKGLIKESN